jgi:hypothetical protein
MWGNAHVQNPGNLLSNAPDDQGLKTIYYGSSFILSAGINVGAIIPELLSSLTRLEVGVTRI